MAPLALFGVMVQCNAIIGTRANEPQANKLEQSSTIHWIVSYSLLLTCLFGPSSVVFASERPRNSHD